ncbi:hypothetical protein KFE25_006733 [Diacronema lutheri]|uniref:Ribosome maturation protein SBDS n=1 Tax=Diacronema lutheri TaxID=2081491 RepID=A0A8J5XF49_DIALT|nr:hypothetical protein KFE25_006733 [Diacronema lutheri]
MPSFLPIGQKRLTNIAVVRIQRGKKKFEIACYPNKVINWRNGVEKDLDEVFQSRQIFVNVSKALVAKRDDLIAAFGTDDEDALSVMILEQGELQVSDKERHLHFDSLFHEVATIVADKCVDASGRPMTVSLIERAMHDAHFSIAPMRSAKQQALDVIRLLEQSGMGISRARMRVRVRAERDGAADVGALLRALDGLQIEREATGDGGFEAVCLIQPHTFRELSHPPKTAPRMAVEVVDARVTMGAGADGGSATAAPLAPPVGVRDERVPPAVVAPRAVIAAADATVAAAADGSGASKPFVCKSCPGAAFATAHAHREHFKSDWHKYNLCLKTKGQTAVTAEEHIERMHEQAADAGVDDFFK